MGICRCLGDGLSHRLPSLPNHPGSKPVRPTVQAVLANDRGRHLGGGPPPTSGNGDVSSMGEGASPGGAPAGECHTATSGKTGIGLWQLAMIARAFSLRTPLYRLSAASSPTKNSRPAGTIPARIGGSCGDMAWQSGTQIAGNRSTLREQSASHDDFASRNNLGMTLSGSAIDSLRAKTTSR